MRNLFPLLLAAALVPIGASALSAQQTPSPTTTATSQTKHHTRTHHRRHTTASARRHARSRTSVRTVSTLPPPTVLGTPAAGFPPPPHAMMSTMGANNPSGISAGGRLQRLTSGLITPDAARSIALRTIPNGTSVDKIRLRTEDGRQVYDVKVITPNQTGNEMVRVDAHTGAVVETKNVDNPVGTVKGAVNKAVNKVKHP